MDAQNIYTRIVGIPAFTPLEWVDRFNNCRLLESIGYGPPAEYEAAYYRRQAGQAMAA